MHWGEEPYSLAILLSQVIPDLADWHVTILATDINERFLQKAAAGIYSQWSFRDTPAGFPGALFPAHAGNGRHALLPEITAARDLSHPLNLAEDVFPSLETDTNAMDLIFCRNVLMYFTLAQARKVVGNLRRSLVEDGWLAVSASERRRYCLRILRTEISQHSTLSEDRRPRSLRTNLESVAPIKPPVESITPVPAPHLTAGAIRYPSCSAGDRTIKPPLAPTVTAAQLLRGALPEAAEMLLDARSHPRERKPIRCSHMRWPIKAG